MSGKPTFGSLFSGIGGFDLGLEAAGWECVWQVEREPAANRVLAAHWPNVQRYDDVRTVGRDNLRSVDLVCGGFPCQDVSLAGRRAGLAGERSGLWHEFRRIIAELTPRWVLIENVPGLLSSGHRDQCVQPQCKTCAPGLDLATVLRGLEELGYGWAYRVLDSRHFGVAQRRRRVFIVASLGGGSGPAQVLFEPQSLRGDSAQSRASRTRVAAGADGGPAERGGVSVASMLGGGNYGQGNLTEGVPMMVMEPHRTLRPDGSVDSGWTEHQDAANALHGSSGSGGNKSPVVVSTLQGGGRRGYRVDAESAGGATHTRRWRGR